MGLVALVFYCLIAIAFGGINAGAWWAVRKFVENPVTRRYLLTGTLAVTSMAATWFVGNSWVYISPEQVGTVVKLIGGDHLPPGKTIALDDEAGYQADVLTAGYHFGLFPFMYEVEISDAVTVPHGSIGIVEALDGKTLPSDSDSSMTRWKTDDWLTPNTFLAPETLGYRGIQMPPLKPGMYHLHPKLFRVLLIDTTVKTIYFGQGDGRREGGYLEHITARAKGVKILINLWVRYRIDPDEAGVLLARLGSEKPLEEAERAVRSATRSLVRDIVAKKQVLELDQARDAVGKEVKTSLAERLKPEGITIVEVLFTSIFDDVAEGGMLASLRNELAERQLAREEPSTFEEQIKAEEARAKLQKIQDENMAARLERKARAEFDAAQVLDQPTVTRVRALEEALGADRAALVLSVEAAAEGGVQFLPYVLMSSEGDAVSPLLESVLNDKKAGARAPGQR